MGDHDADLILIAGSLLAAGIIGALLADRMRVPGLLLFLGLGMLAGSQGIGGIEFSDAELARTLGTIALVLIIFEGGLTAGWSEIRPVLGTAASLATVGTALTAVIAGLAAKLLFDLSTLEGMLVGAAIAATDSAAIFAVLRRSNLEKRLARSLEGESGMNDPVALLLVIGFIEWIQDPGFGAAEMAELLVLKLALGAAIGLALGWVAVARPRPHRPAQRRPLPGRDDRDRRARLRPAGDGPRLRLPRRLSDRARPRLGPDPRPAHGGRLPQGLGWVAQIALFILLGLLVFPSSLDNVALDALALSAVLIFVARPVAAFAATAFAPLNVRERLMLGWAGLRGATPIWLATFPVVAGIGAGEKLFAVVFFVVVTSTLIQGASFEPLARRLGLTTDEPALPRRLFESGRIRRMGGDVISYRLPPGAAAAGHVVRELDLPREALVNVIVRDGNAIPPRGSTELEEGDELHILVRSELRDEVEALTRKLGRGTDRQTRSAAPAAARGLAGLHGAAGARRCARRRDRRDSDRWRSCATAASRRLPRGPRRRPLRRSRGAGSSRSAAAGPWPAGARGGRNGPRSTRAERAWWQEVTGALIARGARDRGGSGELPHLGLIRGDLRAPAAAAIAV